MPDSPSKKRWDAENTKIFSVKLFRKTEQDVIEYLEDRNKRETIVKAIRMLKESEREDK